MAASWIEKLRKALPWIGVVFLQLVNVGNTIITKAALLEGMHFSMLSCFRNMIASVALLPIVFIQRHSLPNMTMGIFLQILALGVLEPGLDQNFLYAGSKQTPAGFLSCMAGVRPALTFIAAWIFSLETVRLNERNTQEKLIVTIIMAGSAIIIGLYSGPTISSSFHSDVREQVSGVKEDYIVGSTYVFISVVSYVLYIILSGLVVSALATYVEYGDKQQGPGICHCLQPLVNDFGDIIWINSTRRKCAFRKCDRSDSDYRWIVHFIMGQKRERRSAVGGLAVGYSMIGWIDESGTLVEGAEVSAAAVCWSFRKVAAVCGWLLLFVEWSALVSKWWLLHQMLCLVCFVLASPVGSPVWPAAGLLNLFTEKSANGCGKKEDLYMSLVVADALVLCYLLCWSQLCLGWQSCGLLYAELMLQQRGLWMNGLQGVCYVGSAVRLGC
ncbi:WAT1-related protein [Camellia lanceoleosa]|nr:WAT1-related protein [Camellia lanceoleosa]